MRVYLPYGSKSYACYCKLSRGRELDLLDHFLAGLSQKRVKFVTFQRLAAIIYDCFGQNFSELTDGVNINPLFGRM